MLAEHLWRINQVMHAYYRVAVIKKERDQDTQPVLAQHLQMGAANVDSRDTYGRV